VDLTIGQDDRICDLVGGNPVHQAEVGDEGVATPELLPFDVAHVRGGVDGDGPGDEVVVAPTEPMQALVLVRVDRYEHVQVGTPPAEVVRVRDIGRGQNQQREGTEEPHLVRA